MENGSNLEEKKSNEAQPSIEEVTARIAVASKKLNAAAEVVTREIEQLEDQLVEADPGVTVWTETLLAERATYQKDDDTAPESVQRHVMLGFAKVKKKKWAIAIREELKGKKGVVMQEEVSSLRKSDRHLRLLAQPHLADLARAVLAVLEDSVALLPNVEAQTHGDEDSAAEAKRASAVD